MPGGGAVAGAAPAGERVPPVAAPAADAAAGGGGLCAVGRRRDRGRALELRPGPDHRRPAARRPAPGRGAVLCGRPDLRHPRLRGGPRRPAQTGGRRMTYTVAALLGVAAAAAVDLFVVRTRLLTRAVFWATYPIIIAFQ